ncbi:hypothetical protein [Rhodococcus gannanensis]|uniref:Uncharacterized protein n=1 Tax=Rhodococcus gannanensis TaxID=1960308 RepID=A0ABW4NZY0_9NOCA
MSDLPFDINLWYHLAATETKVAVEINRLEAFVDAKSPRITMMREVRGSLSRLMTFVIANGLAPREIAAGDEKRAGVANAETVSAAPN